MSTQQILAFDPVSNCDHREGGAVGYIVIWINGIWTCATVAAA